MTVTSRQEREETTPLLDSSLSNYRTGASSDSEDRITILTSNPPSISDGKSSVHHDEHVQQPQQQTEDILASRLNGASLLTILFGYAKWNVFARCVG